MGLEKTINEEMNREDVVETIKKPSKLTRLKTWALTHKAEIGGAALGSNYILLSDYLNSHDVGYILSIMTRYVTFPAFLSCKGLFLGINKLGIHVNFYYPNFYDVAGIPNLELPLNTALWTVGGTVFARTGKNIYKEGFYNGLKKTGRDIKNMTMYPFRLAKKIYRKIVK